MVNRSKHCLVGIPDHEGVGSIGGRLGAALGPRAFREALARFAPDRGEAFADEGDLGGFGRDVTANLARAAQGLLPHLGAHHKTVVIGGSHEHGASVLAALHEVHQGKKSSIACINVDAHLDLRAPVPQPSSGSPFTVAIEAGHLDPKHLTEFGIQDHCNAQALWDYASQHRIRVVPFAKLRRAKVGAIFSKELHRLARLAKSVFVSFDLDALAEAYAPGVSAPQAEGFTASDALEMVEAAGRHPQVSVLGIFELNPLHDRGGQTARLAATLAHHFWAASAR